jgi:hypothetical protein
MDYALNLGYVVNRANRNKDEQILKRARIVVGFISKNDHNCSRFFKKRLRL